MICLFDAQMQMGERTISGDTTWPLYLGLTIEVQSYQLTSGGVELKARPINVRFPHELGSRYGIWLPQDEQNPWWILQSRLIIGNTYARLLNGSLGSVLGRGVETILYQQQPFGHIKQLLRQQMTQDYAAAEEKARQRQQETTGLYDFSSVTSDIAEAIMVLDAFTALDEYVPELPSAST